MLSRGRERVSLAAFPAAHLLLLPQLFFLLLSLWSLAVDLNIRGDRDLVGRLMAPAPQMDRK